MPNENQKPVVFLAFANDHNDKTRYLRELREETRALQAILESVEQEGLCQLVVRPFATINDVLDVFRTHRDQIVIFHFAGHANGYQLLLESSEGEAAAADAGGLAAFLGQQEGLQLVFLNGCSTQQQVKGLLEANVPTIIATSWEIDDHTATEFASEFYKGLATKAHIRKAYNEAEAAIKVVLGDNSRGAAHRVVDSPKDQWPWGLYCQKEDQAADQWDLITPILLRQDRSRLPFEPETIYIPHGEFKMGRDEDEDGVKEYETPQYTVDLVAYRIGKYPITNDQYKVFIQKTGRLISPEAGWDGQTPPADTGTHPVSGITWNDAKAYCEWLSEQTERKYCLPNEAQWEKAARYTDGRAYPWGNDWDENRCNHGNEGITPVDRYPAQSEYGCYDMVGNVREWVSTRWGHRRHQPDDEFRYPWVDDDREDLEEDDYILRVYRGGSIKDKQSQLRCGARGGFAPNKHGPPGNRHGFRVVLRL